MGSHHGAERIKQQDPAIKPSQPITSSLEPVTGAPAEERSPYPGLSSFTEKDAGVFFGREGEVKALWGRVEQRKLLAS